ncbi:exonuclease subunit SbcD [Endozoicomonas sp. 8E]|uniref:exonuclease subunit SbcD n=1 Tax=Endozoicomonas sp. 8E TaxID=3035692 RepID=UPI002938D37A|nr:exonuclease subunit SbcD [Endozoicomonas sp. 8E]WOG28345.1 exonuclease subunit SbcD [Endozoicomonas sp. 8E]
MRILHTSDWHLGQHFIGKSREPEHQAFIRWLLETVDENSVDAIIVAGDIFDTGTPPSYARTLYNRFIVNLQKTCCQQLIIVGGNHDSVSTLNESRDLLACLNTHVVGGVTENPEDQIVTLKNHQGEPGAVVCAIPFIRPRDVLESQAGDSDTDKQQALQNAIARHYQKVFELASDKNLPTVATGHLTTVGGQMSESVRDIYIGTLSAFPVSAFPPADYIALGHLHRAQKVSDQAHIRYSGSPIPLSFDETSCPKQVVLVDLEPGTAPEIKELEVPTFRSLKSLKGSLKTIQQALDKINDDSPLTTWLELEVSTDDYLTDLQKPIQIMLEGRNLEVLRVRRKREINSAALQSECKETLDELDVAEVFARRLNDEDLDEQRTASLNRAFNEILATLDEPDDDNKTARLEDEKELIA